ncbi:MAG: NUDIX domain-containing protein [Desulfuromonadales bacterium]
MLTSGKCPHCGKPTTVYRNPVPTVDIIVNINGGVVLIERRNPPHGWALPGGFVDYGETLEDAAFREAREEIGLEVYNLRQFHSYSDPLRDPRQHTISTVFTAEASGIPRAGDDAQKARIFPLNELPSPLSFDHARILSDYVAWKK